MYKSDIMVNTNTCVKENQLSAPTLNSDRDYLTAYIVQTNSSNYAELVKPILELLLSVYQMSKLYKLLQVRLL